MKTLKYLFSAGVLMTLLLTSCSKEKNDDLKTGKKSLTAVYDFLDEYYSNADYYLGAEITTIHEDKNVNVIEVIVGEDETARGYVAINSDTEEFLYFADIDRDGFVFTVVDIATTETTTMYNINEHEDYELSEGFDLVGFGDPENPNGGGSEGRRFWGNETTYGPCNNGFRTSYTQHYVFWIKNGDPEIGWGPC